MLVSEDGLGPRRGIAIRLRGTVGGRVRSLSEELHEI